MHHRHALALNFGVSAAVLVIEIMAGRIMAPFVGVSLETFTGIIGTVLAGIAAGSFLGGRLADRRPPRRLLGPTLVLGAALTLLAIPIVAVIGPGADGSVPSIVLLTFTAFFAPAAVLSAVGPILAKIRIIEVERTGTVVGGLSAAGTAGALFGTFITGFVLVRWFGSRSVIIAVAGVLALTGAWLWMRLGVRSRSTMSALGVVPLAALAALMPSRCEFETRYACVEVVHRGDSGRLLVMDASHHSFVDLEDPLHLDFRYIRLFANVIDGLPAGPLEVLHIGGGGFTMPRYVAATRPGSRSTVIEIDEQLVDIARDRLGLQTDDRLAVITGDARLRIRSLDDGLFDVVVGDAFGGQVVPWHLTTVEFVEQVAGALRPGGIYVLNVIDAPSGDFAAAQTATLAQVFEHVQVIVHPDLPPSANHVLVASADPLPAFEIDDADGRSLAAAELDALIARGTILTDDFAPVDQLMDR